MDETINLDNLIVNCRLYDTKNECCTLKGFEGRECLHYACELAVPLTDANPAYEALGELAKQLVVATLHEGEARGYANESEEAICAGQYDKGRDWLDHAVSHIMDVEIETMSDGNANIEDDLAHAITDIVCEYRRRQLAQAQKGE